MLVWVVISILILPLILILAAPFFFTMSIRRDEKNHYTTGVSWLWGGLTLKVENGRGTLLAGSFALKKILFDQAHSARKKKAKSKKSFRSITVFKIKEYLNTELITFLFKTLRQIWATLSIKLEGKATFGFEDPALTGLTYGFMAAVGLSGQHPGLKLTPDFLEAGFEGFLSVRGRFTVGTVLFILGRFLLSRPVRRLWWPWPRRKEVEKEWQKSTLSIT